jgi:hypothetical protein
VDPVDPDSDPDPEHWFQEVRAKSNKRENI